MLDQIDRYQGRNNIRKNKAIFLDEKGVLKRQERKKMKMTLQR